METIPCRPLPIDQSEVVYEHGPDSERRPGIPEGRTVEVTLPDSAIYPGTSRRVWVHVPAGHDAATQACVVVFQDGWWYLDPDERKNRNAEYDAFDDRYAAFLLDEVLPRVQERWALSADPAHRALCGGSSGGNGSLTAAWMRPDQYGRVVAFLSSFAQMPEGNPYPRLIADTPAKPLRIFLQAGHRDLGWDAPEWNWLAENLRVAAALAEAGYDVRLVLGDGGHSPNHGGVLLPDALRWAFRPTDDAEAGR